MKARKLNGKPCVMVPADMFLALARAYLNPLTTERPFFVELANLESKAYRKVREHRDE